MSAYHDYPYGLECYFGDPIISTNGSYNTIARALEEYKIALVYDTSLKRWGKLVAAHTDIIELNLNTKYVSPTYLQQSAVTFSSLSATSYTNMRITLNGVDRSKKRIALFRQDGSVVACNTDIQNYNSNAVMSFGQIALKRKTMTTIQKTVIENVVPQYDFKFSINRSIDGTNNFAAPVFPALNNLLLNSYNKEYNSRITGRNFVVNITGSFDLVYLEMTLTEAGNR